MKKGNVLTMLANVYAGKIAFFGSLASIIAVIIIFITDKNAVIIALLFFCILLLAFFYFLLKVLLKLAPKSGSDFDSQSNFIKYEAVSENKIVHEVYRLIQCKQPVLNEFIFNYKWTGSLEPKIESNLQIIKSIVKYNDSNKYDEIVLSFKNPLYFNETRVIHIKMELDDTDKKSDTFLSSRILQPVDVIHFRVVLKYRDDFENAILEKISMSSVLSKYEKIREIAFDKETHSFEHHLLTPDVGYIYRIRWNR